MCLCLRGNRGVIAEADIVCYKVVKDGDISKLTAETENIFYTYYQGFPVEMGKEFDSLLIIKNNRIDIGLHSFAILEDAKEFLMRKALAWSDKNLYIVKCIIPKGSKYCDGFFVSYTKKFESFASDTLRYVEIIFNYV